MRVFRGNDAGPEQGGSKGKRCSPAHRRPDTVVATARPASFDTNSWLLPGIEGAAALENSFLWTSLSGEFCVSVPLMRRGYHTYGAGALGT